MTRERVSKAYTLATTYTIVLQEYRYLVETNSTRLLPQAQETLKVVCAIEKVLLAELKSK